MATIQKELDTIFIELRDPDHELTKLLEYIRILSAPGHSFEVVVDPDMSEHKKSFFMDGDGSFFIKKIEFNERKLIIKDNKVIESYLSKIQ